MKKGEGPTVIRVKDPNGFPVKPLILYTSMNEADIISWAEGKGVTTLWLYRLRYTHGDNYIGAVLQEDVHVSQP